MNKTLRLQILDLPVNDAAKEIAHQTSRGPAEGFQRGHYSALDAAAKLVDAADKERDELIFVATRALNNLRAMGVQPRADSESQSEQVCAELIQALAKHSK